MHTSRFAHLDQLMASNHIDAIVLNPGSTMVYLTGLHFHLMERPTVLLYKCGDQPHLILPELEAGKLNSISFPIVAHTFGDNPSTWPQVFTYAAVGFTGKHLKIGVEASRMRFLEMEYLQRAIPDASFVNAESVLGRLRVNKDEAEIANMQKAVQIAEKALDATLPFIKPGVSEQELASELIIQLFKAGSSSELPFAPIIAGGPNSANPHAVPSARKLKRGDMVIIDWGASYEDAISDLTRTFALGEITPEFIEIFEIVKKANTTGRETGKPGIPAGIVDDATRKVIDQSGYGKFFTHRTGHGIGMEAHEHPYIFSGNELILEKGMTYTIEPGIYLPDKGGVRIEDNMVITADGSRSLSTFPRELRIL